jgi:hypothetical protein
VKRKRGTLMASWRIVRIVSGGQTGADRGGLDAAIAAGVPHGGWCPKGRLAEDGGIPDRYSLTEHASAAYIGRTEANVVDSDATLVFTPAAPTGGSLATIRLCEEHGKPWLAIQTGTTRMAEAVQQAAAWLESLVTKEVVPKALVLNIAGSRESNAPGVAAYVQEAVFSLLRGR